MKHVYVIWCEWDIGAERKVFKTEKLAWDYVGKVWDDDLMGGITLEDAIDDSLVGVDKYRFYYE